MKIVIQPADLEKEKELLITTLRQYLTASSNESRFDWLYRQNPHGAPKAWLARDSESGEVVGASAAFRRRAVINGHEKRGWVLGDFCMADKCRSLGPALQLQRATLAAVAELPESDFCYDFPSLQLTAIYRRLGIVPSTQMVRMAKPLRLDQKLQQLGRLGTLARPAAWIGNFLLQLSDYRTGSGTGWDIAIHEGECGHEFTHLRERMRAAEGVEIQRSAEYLNWRYLRHPFFRHQILTARARKSGELQGYLVFTCGDGNAQIVEWCTGDNLALLRALVRNLALKLRKAGAMTLSAFLLQSDPHVRVLKTMGFWPRESTPLMVNWPASSVVPAGNWLLMYGDRDS